MRRRHRWPTQSSVGTSRRLSSSPPRPNEKRSWIGCDSTCRPSPCTYYVSSVAFPRRGPDWSDARPSGMRELQVAPPDRAGMGRLDRAGRVRQADEEAGSHGRRTKTPHPFEADRGPRGGLWQAGRVRELGLRRRPDDREQDPREDAGYGKGVPERSVRGETQVRHHAAVLERAAGEAQAVLILEQLADTPMPGSPVPVTCGGTRHVRNRLAFFASGDEISSNRSRFDYCRVTCRRLLATGPSLGIAERFFGEN